MKVRAWILLCTLNAACATAEVAPQSAESGPRVPPEANTLRFTAGLHQLDKDDWSPAEEQFTFGAEYVREPAGALVGFELGGQLSFGGDQIDVSGGGHADVITGLAELYGGVHKTFLRDHPVHPYIGAGVTWLAASYEIDGGTLDTKDDDSSVGAYAHAGVETALSRTMAVGLDLRAVGFTDLDMFGASADADYFQAGVFLAVGF